MANFLTDNEDLRFYVERAVDWERLAKHAHMGRPVDLKSTVQNYRDILDLVGQFSAEEIAPFGRDVDEQTAVLEEGEVNVPPRIAAIFDRMKELELHGLCLPEEVGGLNCPMMVYVLAGEMIARSEVSVMTHWAFHGGMAMAMLIYSMDEGSTEFDLEDFTIRSTRWQPYIQEILEGKSWGSMDITEAHAGSDMAQMRTRADRDDNGHWTVTGTKIFITSGHGRFHFVIARTDHLDDEHTGLLGLSLFLVPAYTENPDGTRIRHATLDRVDEKLGHHGSVTVQITFDRSPAELIGQVGDGFRNMLLIMNNARINVGFEALGLMECAYRMAASYAADRPAMGKTIDKHELIADMLDEMRTDIQGLRALGVEAAFHEEMSQRLKLRTQSMSKDAPEFFQLNKEFEFHKSYSRLTTPLIKFLGAEKAVEFARRNMQIHGGSGYMCEYDAEKLLRDSLVLPIYEGTTQIQALMATKDHLGAILRAPGRVMVRMIMAWLKAWLTPPLGCKRRLAQIRWRALHAQFALIVRVVIAKWRRGTSMKHWDPKSDFAPALLQAENLSALLVDRVILDLLARQAQDFPDRQDVLERYLERAEPRSRYLHEKIRRGGRRLLDQLTEQQA
ncbi:MAG: acyl-CoA dehydrogenase family protein [Myxococcota bacterium]|nr:acyl-CoA dehydrogenase family protein [Myxococcota bacterium]